MGKTWFMFLTMLCALASALALAPRPTAAAEKVETKMSGTGFPDYTKQQEMDSCLFGYGTENTSIVDCIARDEKMRVTLAKVWSNLDDHFRKDCIDRLATRNLNSYYYLDHCIRNAQHDAVAKPE